MTPFGGKHAHEATDPFAAIGGRHTDTTLDQQQAAIFSARVKKRAARVAAADAKARAKAEAKARHQNEKNAKSLLKQQERQRLQAEAEMDALNPKVKRDAAESERKERRAREDAEEKQAREERKRYIEAEKERKRADTKKKAYMGGVAWGFDPNAGVQNKTLRGESYGRFVSEGKTPGVEQQNVDELVAADGVRQRTGQRHRGTTWGIEAGGPAREANFESGRQGTLRSRSVSPWRSANTKASPGQG